LAEVISRIGWMQAVSGDLIPINFIVQVFAKQLFEDPSNALQFRNSLVFEFSEFAEESHDGSTIHRPAKLLGHPGRSHCLLPF
jgi:hypothetical protein